MFEPETEVVELQSRLGRVGSIQAWNPWKSRRSVDDAKWWVSKIARLSHGLEQTEDYAAHFDRVVNQMHHESVLEFVPTSGISGKQSLPRYSLRSAGVKAMKLAGFPDTGESRLLPASALLVEAPIFVARQWMRHRSFAYLEMSRRYVKGTKVAWNFYGANTDNGSTDGTTTTPFHLECSAEYDRRLDVGWPPEIARGCMPLEAMTKFWVAGFDRDWRTFLALRDDSHAQEEIRVFAAWIANYLEGKNV